MLLKCATFNVLADAYTGYADYGYVNPGLLEKGARTGYILRLIESLDADVVGLQEAEVCLVEALQATQRWQTFWSPKGLNKPDGCLMLVKDGIKTSDFRTHLYGDEYGHVMQTLRIGGVTFANTHIKWAPEGSTGHPGISQTAELLGQLGAKDPAVIFADCNDRPKGPIRHMVEDAGFTNVSGDHPTALVDRIPVALDLLAVRGTAAKHIDTDFLPENIPNEDIPSDHIPIMAYVEV